MTKPLVAAGSLTALASPSGIMCHAELRSSPSEDYCMAMPALFPRYTVDTLDDMPQEPGFRYELLDGFLLVTPPPGQVHATLASRLISALTAAIPESAARVALPGEIRTGTSTSLQPDILVYPSKFRLRDPWKSVTEWWLAVEIVSQSSRVYDREHKRHAYLTLGVPMYWIVDPELRTVEIWRAGDVKPTVAGERVIWTTPSGHSVEIETGKLFEGVGE